MNKRKIIEYACYDFYHEDDDKAIDTALKRLEALDKKKCEECKDGTH